MGSVLKEERNDSVHPLLLQRHFGAIWEKLSSPTLESGVATASLPRPPTSLPTSTPNSGLHSKNRVQCRENFGFLDFTCSYVVQEIHGVALER